MPTLSSSLSTDATYIVGGMDFAFVETQGTKYNSHVSVK